MAKIMKVIVNQPIEENVVEFEERIARVTAGIFSEILPPQVLYELVRVLKEVQE